MSTNLKRSWKGWLYFEGEEKQVKSEAWKLFLDMQKARTKDKTGAVMCVKCKSLLSYSATKNWKFLFESPLMQIHRLSE
jgi:hypothetical protein